MVHSVCGNVDQSGTQRLSPGRGVKIVIEGIIFAVFSLHASPQRKQLFGNNVQTSREA